MSLDQQQSAAPNPRNPHGLGDPNDTTLRKVEREVLIPKIMRDRARAELCTQEVADFEECCKASSIFMVATCRKQNSALMDCLSRWYQNEAFKEECRVIYLKERSEYRSTGIPKKHRVEKI
ncbi:COX assembly mitochondrial protein homolog [Drosophila albomicans]|uniref:COX assembly mitochondrial protein n=1 Tax=Drosophila albomicans TaxID=7291 RepID=A0A6P8WS34_DROAB|nr:COX assembly mitochondrial protein homolog [Drosophila albomicans]